MPAYNEYPVLAGTDMAGFAYGSILPLEESRVRGAGFLQGPDGSRAGLQWELADTPFIMKVEGPDAHGWGIYRVGFTRPVDSVSDLTANLHDLLPRLRILYARMRVN